MHKIVKWFLNGLLIFGPIALTIVLIVWIFTGLDSILRGLFHINIPGLGLLLTIGLILFIGFLASNFVGRRLFEILDHLMERIPLIKLLHGALKDIINAFAGERKSFDKPVLVQLVPGGPKVMGFITRENMEILGLVDEVAVYVPQSYNWAGSILIYPASQVKPIAMDSGDAMAFIVSGGVAGKKKP